MVAGAVKQIAEAFLEAAQGIEAGTVGIARRAREEALALLENSRLRLSEMEMEEEA